MERMTSTERRSERELVVTRLFPAPPERLFAAWTRPDLLERWWVPASFGISFISCHVDARTGGSYRFVFAHRSSADPIAFFGRYIEVSTDARLVWTNEEAGDGGALTSVTFEPHADGTLLVLHELYPSKEALDEAIASGSTCGFGEAFGQLDELLGLD